MQVTKKKIKQHPIPTPVPVPERLPVCAACLTDKRIFLFWVSIGNAGKLQNSRRYEFQLPSYDFWFRIFGFRIPIFDFDLWFQTSNLRLTISDFRLLVSDLTSAGFSSSDTRWTTFDCPNFRFESLSDITHNLDELLLFYCELR